MTTSCCCVDTKSFAASTLRLASADTSSVAGAVVSVGVVLGCGVSRFMSGGVISDGVISGGVMSEDVMPGGQLPKQRTN